MSIHETMDQSKILFDEATQQLNIRIHEQLAFWMVSNLGCTCPFVLDFTEHYKGREKFYV
jgi:hypothetical protein